MKEELIKQALNELADKAIPSDYDPYPLVRKRVDARLQSQKNPIERTTLSRGLGLAGTVVLLLILGGIIFFLTPTGRGVAQTLVHYFTFAEGNVLPLPTDYATDAPPPTRTTAPTRVVNLKEVTSMPQAPAPYSYPTATQAVVGAADDPIWNLTLEQAEQLAGYKLRVPLSLPPGYRLDNVTFDPKTREVVQFYKYHPYSAGEQFILHQQPSESVGVVGHSAYVYRMTIGGVEVEYVSGSWQDDPGANTESWQSDSIFHTFRWQEGEIYFTLDILFDDSEPWRPAYWTKDSMLAMIEIILGVRDEFPEQINLNFLTSIEQAEGVAGFDILAPSILPEGFIFSRGVFDPDARQVILFYQPESGSRDSSGTSLRITEKVSTGQPDKSGEGFPPDAIESVMVDSNLATFIRGAIVDGSYDPEASLSLVWDTAELTIRMIYSTSSSYPGRLEKDELIEIAESME